MHDYSIDRSSSSFRTRLFEVIQKEKEETAFSRANEKFLEREYSRMKEKNDKIEGDRRSTRDSSRISSGKS